MSNVLHDFLTGDLRGLELVDDVSFFVGELPNWSRLLTGWLNGFFKTTGNFLVGDGSVKLLRHFIGDWAILLAIMLPDMKVGTDGERTLLLASLIDELTKLLDANEVAPLTRRFLNRSAGFRNSSILN